MRGMKRKSMDMMSNMMSRLYCRPKRVLENMKQEGMRDKIRLVCFSAAMGVVATIYQGWFDNLLMRAGQYQEAGLAGELQFKSYDSQYDQDRLFEIQNKIDVIDEVSTKDLYFIEQDWVDRYYDQYYAKNVTTVNNGETAQVTFDSAGNWQYSGGNVYYQYQNSTGSVAYSSQQDLWGRLNGQLYTTVNQTSGQLEGQITDLESNADYYMLKEFVSSYTGPNGRNDLLEEKFFTQKERKAKYQYKQDVDNVRYGGYYTYQRHDDEYNQWKDMREWVMWFDTVGCEGPHIGDGLDFDVGFGSSWLQGRTGNNQQIYSVDQRDYNITDGRRFGQTHDQWDNELSVSNGLWAWKDLDVLKERLHDEYDLWNDCDMECQQRGSGLSMVAILMGAAYGLIGLNALFMFFGSFRPMCRLCSLYCTVFACMVQLVVQLIVAALLFSDYTELCSRSLTLTANPKWNVASPLGADATTTAWTMSDDIFVARYLWGWGFVFMFAFCCCGLCNGFSFGPGGGNSIMVINKMLD